MDHYALATQMGTSVKMIEQHYGHITPAHIADRLAGPKMEKEKTKKSISGSASDAEHAAGPKKR
jgi:hypothetical protein